MRRSLRKNPDEYEAAALVKMGHTLWGVIIIGS
jgi:hypothetical protein